MASKILLKWQILKRSFEGHDVPLVSVTILHYLTLLEATNGKQVLSVVRRVRIESGSMSRKLLQSH